MRTPSRGWAWVVGATLLTATAPAFAGAEEGRPIYVAKCQACHGASGKGDGPAARALPKPPRDFTSAEFWSSTTDDAVKTVVRQGLPGTIMRGFPMPDDQADNLLAYLRSLAENPAPKP
ncbi:MAG: cytochrome c [Alphaproteobacteria bacterium]|nr:cytochrome c [Alphaproteobacteria bacterium]